MANKILIPVDFSIHSKNAIHYACKLQLLNPHDIDLLHVFPTQNNAFSNKKEDLEIINPNALEGEKSMQVMLSELRDEYPNTSFTAVYREGKLYESVKNLVVDNSYDAIIMGTKGASGLDALLNGSNMFDVFLNSNVPVLAVPFTDKLFNTDKIGLLCNFKDGELDVLNQAIKLYGREFELVLIHINTSDDSINNLDKKFELFIDRIVETTQIDNISYVIKSQTFFIQFKEDISSAINSVITDESLNGLLVTKSKKSFLRKIVEENIVKKMAYDIQIPKFFGKSHQ